MEKNPRRHLGSQCPMSEINEASLLEGPAPWAASVKVTWDWRKGLSKRNRSTNIRKFLKSVDILDYQTRYDNVIDATFVYFRNKDDAVAFYFYIC